MSPPGGCRGTEWPWPAGAAAGLRSGGHGLTPGQGGEEGEVCAAGAHSLGGNVGTPHGAPVPGTNSKTTCFLLLTPGAQPAPRAPLTPWWLGSRSRNDRLREDRLGTVKGREGPHCGGPPGGISRLNPPTSITSYWGLEMDGASLRR